MRITKRRTERARGKSTRSVLRKRNRARINLEWLRFRARLARPESNDRGAAGLRYLLRHKLAHGTESESRNFIRGRVRDLYVSSGLSIAAAATAYSTSDVWPTAAAAWNPFFDGYEETSLPLLEYGNKELELLIVGRMKPRYVSRNDTSDTSEGIAISNDCVDMISMISMTKLN